MLRGTWLRAPALWLCLASSAAAQPSEGTAADALRGEPLAMADVAPKRRAHYDYSRFSNGPRHVPRPRGASLERAERLGIGGLEATREILRGRIDAALAEQVQGERPRELLWPVVGGHFGRGFGYTRRVRTDLRHNGVDIGGPPGAVVRAAADGLVVYSDNTIRGMGNAVVILHPGGLITLYAHNERTTVQPGWRVRRGERIALVGQTGIARGPHLHFELRDGGRLVDPARLFVGRRSEEVSGPLVALDGEDGAATGSLGDDTSPAADQTLQPATDQTDAGADPATGATEEDSWPFAIGSERAARSVLRRPPRLDEDTDARLGRRFQNLLWPLKDGRLAGTAKGARGGVELVPASETAVRAVADGVVVHAGPLRGHGEAVVILHREGWVSVYSITGAIAVEAGRRVQRGEWIGHVAADGSSPARLRFEWRVAGKRRDPLPHFVGRPLESL